MANKWVKKLQCCCLIFINLIAEVFKNILKIFQTIKENDVKNEIVLITGAAQGIGKELAMKYGQLEAKVICVDIKKEENDETVRFLNMIGAKALGFQCNIKNFDEVKALRENIEREIGSVTILIANAGVACQVNFLENIPDKDINNVLSVNLISLFWLLKEFLPSMKKNNKGHIVTISSITGLGPLIGISTYSVSKCAVAYLMRAAREEVEHEGLNVKFTTVYPDFTDTPMCNSQKKAMPQMLTTSEVANRTIQAQRRGESDVSIPGHFYRFSKILNAIKAFSGAEIKYYANLLEGTEDGRRWQYKNNKN